MTVEQAKQLSYGQVLYLNDRKNADGTPMRVRVTGQVKTWKRDQGRVRVPIKHGLYESGYITEENVHRLELNEEDA